MISNSLIASGDNPPGVDPYTVTGYKYEDETGRGDCFGKHMKGRFQLWVENCAIPYSLRACKDKASGGDTGSIAYRKTVTSVCDLDTNQLLRLTKSLNSIVAELGLEEEESTND
tara:strand:+ start:92 stop:433 length:342 start_codon:yes stop_codon:yes gene_type:complete